MSVIKFFLWLGYSPVNTNLIMLSLVPSRYLQYYIHSAIINVIYLIHHFRYSVTALNSVLVKNICYEMWYFVFVQAGWIVHTYHFITSQGQFRFKWIAEKISCCCKQDAHSAPLFPPTISCLFLRSCSPSETDLFCLDGDKECGLRERQT